MIMIPVTQAHNINLFYAEITQIRQQNHSGNIRITLQTARVNQDIQSRVSLSYIHKMHRQVFGKKKADTAHEKKDTDHTRKPAFSLVGR